MMTVGATYIGVATDHVIESFRNRLWPGYKTGDGIEPPLLAQFPLLEETLQALGVAVWPMVEFEADDALAAAAAAAAADPRVDRVFICTPDKDLAQSVRGTRVVQMDRRSRTIRDEAGVVAKFGVPPASIPDYLALVGDAADGYPGLAGWGAKSAAAVLAKYQSPRIDSGGLDDVARERLAAGGPGGHAGAGTRSGVALPRSRHASDDDPACSTAWTICDGTGRGPRSRRWPRGSTPQKAHPTVIRGAGRDRDDGCAASAGHSYRSAIIGSTRVARRAGM